MQQIDNNIRNIDKVICENIRHEKELGRGILSQNILAQLRNLVENICMKIYVNDKKTSIKINEMCDIKKSYEYVKSSGKYRFLSKFHNFLQKSKSHYTMDNDSAERLMLKYYEYLFKTKKFLKETYHIEILDVLYDFPLNLDDTYIKYYEKIANKMNSIQYTKLSVKNKERYYIEKIKPFFVNNEIYYEISLSSVKSFSKFDRFIVFSKLEIMDNYSIKVELLDTEINMLNQKIPIKIIKNWEVSIRPCELKNLSKILGNEVEIKGTDKEYRELMSFIKQTKLNLLDIALSNEEWYIRLKKDIIQNLQLEKLCIFQILDSCREILKKHSSGENIIRYLLYKMNNRIIRDQYNSNSCDELSNLQLKYQCIPFEEMPFATSLFNHNPRIFDLSECIENEDREHEFLTRLISNNAEKYNKLYTPLEEISNFKNIDELISMYNKKLYYKHIGRRIEQYKNNIYIHKYEEDTLKIILHLLCQDGGIQNYQVFAQEWLDKKLKNVDCNEKREIILKIFAKSKVAIIYGAAGTGKSTLVNHIANLFENQRKLCIAVTNPAVDNLRRKVKANNCDYKTIASFLSKNNNDIHYDLLIIDECSTVSNKDMLNVLNKVRTKLIVLVGDIYQIESISFGNWFYITKNVSQIPHFELKNPYRSNSLELRELWKKVRNLDDDITEYMSKYQYSRNIDETIFQRINDDEITLCLNYDGLYGINNINKLLQLTNKNEAVMWNLNIYKKGDPVLFNETQRFSPILYNNLKGKIVDVIRYDDKIKFDIEIDTEIKPLDIEFLDLELVNMSDSKKPIVRFYVFQSSDTEGDEDENDMKTVVPFQVAYAVSIHKAQGLEYESVKVVITNEIEEKITHNIFYTAITRAIKNLTVYWSPETQKFILYNMKKMFDNRDYNIFTKKNGSLIGM